ncbi:MAG: enoyl-CoA hydratase/isomerase family protein [Oscillospiraceae bacterium]|nr:enoyl-CoA hydratase/isomerase family protein [Oscillospiraceae bacterium]
MNYIKFQQDGHIGIVSLNRPESLNALSTELMGEIAEIFAQLEKNDDIYVIVLTGEGRAFAAGADISEMSNYGVVEGKRYGVLGNDTMTFIENMTKPVIAAVNGFALGGGCELAMCCDIRIASEKAKFGQPEVGLGITPGFGGTQRLPRIVGISKAMELILTARVIGAAEAERIGLVSLVVPPEELMTTAVTLAKAIADQAQVAVRESKKCVRRGMQTDIYTGTAFESEAFGLCFGTEDQKDAMKAFVNKEKLSGFKNR